MLNLVKNFWKELNKIRYVEISYGTEENNKKTQELDFTIDPDSRKLNKDLNERINVIKQTKLQRILENLARFHIDNELSNTGLLLTKKESIKRAEKDVKDVIISGKVDYFYNFVS